MTIGLNVLSREFQESLYKPETHYKSSQSSISAAIPREAPADNSVPDKKLSARKVEGVNVAERIFALIVDSLYICYRTLQIIGHTINIMVRRGSPVSIQQAADGLGGVFLKLLQFICSSETMAQKAFGENHEAYIKALRHVTSNNKQMSTGQLVKCLKDAGIDYHPDMLDDRLNLGTGSIGEVNEIYTMEGQSQDINLRYKTEPSIIVKVVLPANETKILSDIKLINLLMKMVSFFAPKMLASGLKASLTDFIESFKSELNLETEAENTLNQARVFDALPNCEKFTITDEELLPVTSLYLPPDTRMLEDLGVNIRFKVPKVDTRYTTQKTMVMQRVDGVTLTASDENDEKLRGIVSKVLRTPRSFFTNEHLFELRNCIKFMAFGQWLYCYSRSGFFNADIHDGNIMVAAEKVGNSWELCIYFIDLGNTQQHTKEQAIASQKIGIALRELKEPGSLPESLPPITRDQALDEVINCLKIIGRNKQGVASINWPEIREKIDQLVKEGDTEAPEARSIEIFNMIHKYGVETPRDIIALFRAMTLIKSNQPPTEEDLEKIKERLQVVT